MDLIDRLKAKLRRKSSNENQITSGLSNKDLLVKKKSGGFQQDLDELQEGATLLLMPREFLGPIIINKSISLDGQGATIWSLKGPVVSIESDGVVLRNVRIEVTGEIGLETLSDECALQVAPGRSVLLGKEVEVRGTVLGLPQEEGAWRYPHSLYIGNLTYNMDYDFIMRIVVPVPCRIKSNISGLEIEPQTILSGANEIHIHIQRLPHDTLLHGYLSISTAFLKRRITLNGHILSKHSAEQSTFHASGCVIWEPPDWINLVAQLDTPPFEQLSVEMPSTAQIFETQSSIEIPNQAHISSVTVPPRYPEQNLVTFQNQKLTFESMEIDPTTIHPFGVDEGSVAPKLQGTLSQSPENLQISSQHSVTPGNSRDLQAQHSLEEPVPSGQPIKSSLSTPPPCQSSASAQVEPIVSHPVSGFEQIPSSGIRKIEGAPLSDIFLQIKKSESVISSSGTSEFLTITPTKPSDDPKKSGQPVSTLFTGPSQKSQNIGNKESQHKESPFSQTPLPSIMIKAKTIGCTLDLTSSCSNSGTIQTDEEISEQMEAALKTVSSRKEKTVSRNTIPPLFYGNKKGDVEK
ncbi:MAG: hypothetical protein V2B20_09305 [Pseudomonadota bacterium]